MSRERFRYRTGNEGGPAATLPPVMPAANRGAAADRRFLHDDEPRPLEQARADLSHVNACIAIFEAAGEHNGEVRAYVDLHRLFVRGEMMRLCRDGLASGPKSTKELALIVIAAKGLDSGDKVLARAMATRMIHALRQQWRRGHLDGEGKVKGARVWKLKG
jgi:hypothetical protein